MALNQFQKDLRAFQTEIETLRSEIEEKTINLQKVLLFLNNVKTLNICNHLNIFFQVTMSRDSIQAELSKKLVEVENLKESVKELSSKSETSRLSKNT
jgi:hypothetical protein